MGQALRITFEEHDDDRARYVARAEGTDAVAELKLMRTGGDTWVADYTGVPRDLRGTGAGLALVGRLAEDARAQGRRVQPQCPFVKAQALRNAQWRDVFDL